MTDKAVSGASAAPNPLAELVHRWGSPRFQAPPWRLPNVSNTAALALALVAAILLDAPIVRLVAHLPAGLTRTFRLITECGTAGYIYVLCAVVAAAATFLASRFARAHDRAALRVCADRAVFVFIVILVSGLLAQGLKHILARARPKLIDTAGPYHFDFLSLKASLASFPSGHATTAFAAATALGLFWRSARPWLLVAASLVALSRIVLGAHYVSDVAAGGLLGMLSTAALGRMFARRRIALCFRGGLLAPRGDGLVEDFWRRLVHARGASR